MLEVAKHRTSLGKSTDVLHRKYGCLPQRSPMFLISEKGKVLNTDLSDLTDFTLRATYTPLAMYAPSVVYISLNQLGKSPSLTPGPMSLLSSPRKKFWKNILHFLHPYPRILVFTGDFGCRIGCRIAFPGVG